MLLYGQRRRKLRPLLRYIFITLFGAFLLFGICWGMYIWHKNTVKILSPLAHTTPAQKQKDTSTVESVITQSLQNHKIDFLGVKAEKDGTATIILKNNAKVIVSTQKDIESQIASLQLTIANLTIEGKQFQRLDFRFDRPVVTF